MSAERPYSDEVFIRELTIGHTYEQRVAEAIRAVGLDVTVTPFQAQPSYEQRGAFFDSFDLLVGGRIRIEVKSRRVAFTGPEDYPFPTAFVYDLRGWTAKRRKPGAIVLVSQTLGGMAVISPRTEPAWIARAVHDTVKDCDYTVLEVPREWLRPMCDLLAWLRFVL